MRIHLFQPHQLIAALAALAAIAGAPGTALSQDFVAPGDRIRGSLTQSDDTIPRGTHGDLFLIEGVAGEMLRITLRSREFDAYLFLVGADDIELFESNDDGPDIGTDAELTVILPQSGIYLIIATSVEIGEKGRYTLDIESARPVAIPDAVPLAPGSTEIIPLIPGTPVAGSLNTGDLTGRHGDIFDRYTFDGRAGQRIRIDMTSPDFDTMVGIAFDRELLEMADDISAKDTNSSLTMTLPSTGEYWIVATAFGEAVTGNYTISVTLLDD